LVASPPTFHSFSVESAEEEATVPRRTTLDLIGTIHKGTGKKLVLRKFSPNANCFYVNICVSWTRNIFR